MKPKDSRTINPSILTNIPTPFWIHFLIPVGCAWQNGNAKSHSYAPKDSAVPQSARPKDPYQGKNKPNTEGSPRDPPAQAKSTSEDPVGGVSSCTGSRSASLSLPALSDGSLPAWAKKHMGAMGATSAPGDDRCGVSDVGGSLRPGHARGAHPYPEELIERGFEFNPYNT